MADKSESSLQSLNDMNLAALAIGIVIFVSFVLIRERGFQDVTLDTNIVLISIDKIMYDSANQIEASGATLGIFAIVDEKIVYPNQEHKQITIRPFASDTRHIRSVSDCSPSWYIETKGEFSNSDRIVVWLATANELGDPFNSNAALIKVDVNGSEESQPIRRPFYAEIPLQSLNTDVNVSDLHSTEGLFQVNPSPTQFSSDRFLQTTNIGNIRRETSISYKDQKGLEPDQNGEPVCTREVWKLPALYSFPDSIFNRRFNKINYVFDFYMLVENFHPDDTGWTARIIVEFNESDPNPVELLKAFEQLRKYEKYAMPRKENGSSQYEDGYLNHIWHWFRVEEKPRLLIQRSTSAPLINSCSFFLDETSQSKLHQIYLTPEVQRHLTNFEISGEKKTEAVQRIFDAVNTNFSATNKYLFGKERFAFSTDDPGTWHIKSYGGNESYSVAFNQDFEIQNFVLGNGSYFETPRDAATDKFIFVMLMLMISDEPSSCRELGLKQDPRLWSVKKE